MNLIPKQRQIKYIGGVKTIFTRTQFYLSLINFLQMSIVTYTIVVKLRWPWMTWWQYLLGLVVVVLVSGWFEFKIMLPSELAFANWQWWEHGNPLKPAIEELIKEVHELREEVKKLR